MRSPGPLHDRSATSNSPPASSVPAKLMPQPRDRRLYTVRGIGTLRVSGWTSRDAIAEADGRSWQIIRRGIWSSVIQATDVAGDVVGEFSDRRPHHGATLRWSNRETVLQIDRLRHDHYTLIEDGRRLAVIDGTGSTKALLTIMVDDMTDIDPGLLLFAIYVVQTLMHTRTSRGRR